MPLPQIALKDASFMNWAPSLHWADSSNPEYACTHESASTSVPGDDAGGMALLMWARHRYLSDLGRIHLERPLPLRVTRFGLV